MFLMYTMLVFGVICISFSYAGSQEIGKKNSIPTAFTNSIGMEFVLIPSGEFIMGEATREECDTCNALPNETPRHSVTVSKAFYVGRYEVTQEQWLAVMDNNPSLFKGKNRPVENVPWESVQLFIHAINTSEKTDTYRLPTEAEWEYAARAGSSNTYCFGDDPDVLKKYAWYIVGSGAKTHSVGLLLPNSWGLYDVHGNLFEWCQDWYGEEYYSKSPLKDPVGPEFGGKRVRRGGFWGSSKNCCRLSYRDFFSPDIPSSNTGFRLVKEL